MFRYALNLSLVLLFSAVSFLEAGTVTIAHRGASGLAPENTLASYAKAVEIGAEWFELDVWLSKDDSLMLMHDESVFRTTGTSGTIPTMTYAQLRSLDAGSWFSPLFAGEKIPTLAEALDLALAAPYRVGVVIEIKSTAATTVEKVVAAVQQRAMQDRVIISSFNFSDISKSKKLDPSIPVQLFGAIALTQVRQVAAIGGEWVGTSGTVTQVLLDSTHARSMKLNKWTVNSAGEMTPLIKLGVDAITTNFPDIAKSLLDTTPPADVTLLPPVVENTRIGLSWLPAADPESASITYEIYRDTRENAGTLLATVVDTTAYIDDTRLESKRYYYRVRAKNSAGLYSLNYSNEVEATTAPDLRPPGVAAIVSYGRPDHVVILFNERVEKESAETAAFYQITPDITITGARLAFDSLSVILTTSPLAAKLPYTLTITGVKDQAFSPNPIVMPEVVSFYHKPWLPGLVAAWDFDENEGTILHDYSGNANDGALENGPAWAGGNTGNGLLFDGIDDYINVPASPSLDINTEGVSISLWTRLAYVPNDMPGAYGPLYDSEGDNYVLYEDKGVHELRFKVTTSVSAERPGIRSNDLAAERWLHLVGVYDGSKVSIWLDGVLKDSHNLTGTVKAGQIATIGKTGGAYFKGQMDNIQIYNRALSAEEIQFLYSGRDLTNAVEHAAAGPQGCSLAQNYPNPFNPATTLRYYLQRPSAVELAVYDLLGRKVAELVRSTQGEGEHTITWDGLDQSGQPVGSGVYLCRLTAGSYSATRPMLLIR
jgi:glycerophosphoryl diester phosphodiesterase